MIKKIKWSFLAIIAALSMASCSSDEPGKGQDENDGGDVKYLAVQIVTPTASGSRASTDASPKFEDGTTTENEVDHVRFYFFDKSGNAANVKKSGTNYVNYHDWDPTGDANKDFGSGSNNNPHTSKVVNAILIIDPKKGDDLPNEVIAVINPDIHTGLQKTVNKPDLRKESFDYANYANDNNGKSVMCNSTYISGTEIINSTKLSITDFKDSEKEALASPVKIYVERNVAKVRAIDAISADFEKLTLSNDHVLLKVKKKEDNTDYKIGEQQVYIDVHGWNVTQTLEKSTISKYIDRTWTNIFNNTSINWNDPDNRRSYWALSDRVPNTYKYPVSWDQIKLTAIDGSNVVYVNENAQMAGDFSPSFMPSVIIVAATLCKQDGSPLTICKYAGHEFIDDDNLTTLKGYFLDYFKNIGHVHFKKVTQDGKEVFVNLSANDIKFVQDTGADKEKYYAYATLTEDAQKIQWYKFEGEYDPSSTLTEEQITALENNKISTANNNKALNDCLKSQTEQIKALVYQTGRTYYFSPIMQYSKEGVVRNHIYNININGFYGLGTPAFDNNWPIEPEKPGSNEAFLAAEIHILSWHAMTQNVTFD